MTDKLLIDPQTTPNEVGIMLSDDDKTTHAPTLIAVTKCCVEQIYYRDADTPYCSRCDGDQTFFHGRRAGDAYSSYAMLDQPNVYLVKWVSHFTGYTTSDLTIEVK